MDTASLIYIQNSLPYFPTLLTGLQFYIIKITGAS